AAAERRQPLAIEAEGRGDTGHDAVDRRAFLRAAGEIDAAQQRAPFVAVRHEDLAEELLQQLLERGELRREAIDQRALVEIGLLLDARQLAVVDALHQRVETGAEADHGRRLAVAAAIQGQRHAPDLLALLAAQIVEILDESRDQIGLGEEDIDRKADAELVAELA